MSKGRVRGTLSMGVAVGSLVSMAANAQMTPGDLLVSSSTYTDPGFGVGWALPNSAGITAVASSAAKSVGKICRLLKAMQFSLRAAPSPSRRHSK